MLVDDHPVVRSGLRTLLSVAGCSVVGEAGSGEEAVEVASALQPDVVVMDLAMSGMGGIAAIRELVARHPHLRVIVLSMSGDDESVFAAIRAGARGYVLKGTDPEALVRAVHSVADGDAVFGPGLAERMLTYFARPSSAPPRFPELTEREREVLALLAKGCQNLEIGQMLGIRPKTVRNHVSNVLSKLAAADRTEAILRAREAGLG